MFIVVKGFLPVLSLTIFLQFCFKLSIKLFSCFLLWIENVRQTLSTSSSMSKTNVYDNSSTGIPLKDTIGFFILPLLFTNNVTSK